MALQMADLKSYLCSLRRRFLRFTKASFFLSGLVFGNAVAEYSFLGFLIVFIQQKSAGDNDNLRYDATVSTARDGFSAFLASFLAYTTHQRVGPFIMILVNHAILTAGLLILLFHRYAIDGIFYLTLALLSVDNSGEEYMNEFLTDQRAVSELEQVIDDAKKSNNRIDAWRFIARFAGAVIGGLLVSKLKLRIMVIISTISVGIGCIFCYSYSKFYKVYSGDHQAERHDLRPLLKLFPLWAPFLVYYVVDAAANTFIDEAYFYIIQKSSGIIVSRLIGYVIKKFCSELNQQEQKCIRLAKITFGMLVCFLLCIYTWNVLARKSEGLLMSIPQFILLGIMKEMVKEMLGEYFCDQVPDQSLHHLEFTFNSFVEGMGRLLAVVCILVSRNWIGKRVENSHLDNYFHTLTFMSLCALLMFVYLSNTCYWNNEPEDHVDYLEKLEECSLSLSSCRCPSESQSSSLHSSSVSQSTAYLSGDESISSSSEAEVLPKLESTGSSTNRTADRTTGHM